MKGYIEFKIKKRSILILNAILISISSMAGYYFWCSTHPIINIQIRDGGKGEEYKIEMPYTTVDYRHNIKPSAMAESNINMFIMQHELVLHDILLYYKKSDIHLDIETKNQQIILKYSGTATTLNNEVTAYDKEYILDFALDINIQN